MNLFGKYPIYDGEEQAGELEISPWGGYLRFRALCRSRRRGVFRLVAESGGRLMPLGVMTPSGSGFGLERRFSPAALRNMGLERIDRCRLAQEWEEGWQEERSPEDLFRDPALQELGRALGREGVLTRREGEAVLLAVPLDRGRPFAAMPIFCFGSPETINGRNWVVFRIMDGMPAVNCAEERAD
jgi:hypothetical protein